MGLKNRKNAPPQAKRRENSSKGSKEDNSDFELIKDDITLPWHSLAALGIFVSVYVKCTSASIPTGDAGDFIISAHHFGVAHPPGYPLYVSLGHLWMRVFPFGSPAYKLNFLTSIIGGVAAFILYITAYRLTGFAPSAVLASSAFAFSHLTWFHSIGAEIFALNNLFCGLLLYWVIKFQRTSVESRAWVAMEASFISGLSMCNQHTSILYIGVIGLWMFISLIRDQAISGRQFMQTGITFSLGLLPYLQLPLSAYLSSSPSTWGNHKTLSGVVTHIMRNEYGSFRLHAHDRTADFAANLRLFISDMVHELGIPTALFFVLCLLTFRRFSSVKTIVYVYTGALMLYTAFFCKQANIDLTSAIFVGILERFWMQTNLVISVLGGCGLWTFYSLLVQRYPNLERNIYTILSIGSVLFGARQAVYNFSSCDMSNNNMMELYGRNILDGLPPNSVLLLSGDVASYSTRYLRYCTGYREDVDVVAQSRLSYSWYKETHKHSFNHFIFPYNRTFYAWFTKLARSRGQDFDTFDYKDLFDVHFQAGIPVYVFDLMDKTDEAKDKEWQDHYEVEQDDFVQEVRRKDHPQTLDTLLEKMESRKATYTRQLCDKSLYPERSWERSIAEKFCSRQLLIAPINAGLQSIPDVYGQGHLLIENRPAIIRIFKILRRAQETLTFKDGNGNDELVLGQSDYYNLGVVSWMLFKNYKRTDELLEAHKYGRVTVEQWTLFLEKSSDVEPKKQITEQIIKTLLEGVPDLLTNNDYELQF